MKKRCKSTTSKERKIVNNAIFHTTEYHTKIDMNSVHKHRWITTVMVSKGVSSQTHTCE